MRNLATLLLLGVLLTACATPPKAPPPIQLFHDAAFNPPSEAVGGATVFALNEAMRHYLNQDIRRQARSKNLRRALFDALYSQGQLKLEYDAALTRNAVQTFEARAGNCLSLVIMTAALAREMGLTVQYQSVLAEESWSRSGGLYFISNHVNLVLGKHKNELQTSYDAEANLTIDFLPPQDHAGYRTRVLTEDTIVAMYMNNRAAETLAQDKVDDAYWWARAALMQDPAYIGAYNTLGVILRRHGNLEQARDAFAFALERAPSDTLVMSNLALALKALGREMEAQALLARLAQLEPEPPFYFFDLGLAAMRRGDFPAAVRLFSREIARDPYYHEFHFWLAQAYAKLGDLAQAGSQLTLALDNSTTRRDQDLYAAKLERIRAYRAH